MYLKTDRIIVKLKTVTLRSSKTAPTGQFILDPTAIMGWTDGVNTRRSATARAVTSGDFSEPYTYSSRLISFSGTAIAGSRTELQTMRDALVGVLQPGEYVNLSVETSVGTRYATVGLGDNTSWIQHSDTIAVFKLNLYAPDPHIYGPEKRGQAGAAVVAGGLKYRLKYPLNYNYNEQSVNRTVTNYGNAPAYPLFVAVGDFYSGFEISNGVGGNKVRYTGMVTRAAPVTIDMARGIALQNGIDKSVHLTKRDWFSIPPNTAINPVFAPVSGTNEAGSGYCDIIYRDTWI